MRTWFGCLVVLALGACYTAPVAGGVVAGAEPELEPAPEVVAAEPVVVATDSAARLFVAGCNVECTNCTALDSSTFVTGVAASDGRVLFAGPPPGGGPYSCGAQVAVGERVTLSAQGSPLYQFVGWRLFGAGYPNDYCPCAGSDDPVCEVVVDERAARHPRVYCGAMWSRRDRSATAIAR